MVKKLFLIPVMTILVSGLVFSGCAAPAPAPAPAPTPAPAPEVFKWQIQHLWGAGTIYSDVISKLADRIREMSDGRLDIEMLPNGSIVAANESFDAIAKRAFEGHISAPGYWTGKNPVFSILMTVPMGIPNVDDLNAWFWQRGGTEIAREAYAPFNLYFVGPGIVEYNVQFIKEEHPVRTIADYKGLKIRTTPGLTMDLFAALGASPVYMPMSDVYTAVETGVLDGVAGYTVVGWYDFGIHELTKWVIMPGWLQPATNLDVVVNLDAWKELPADLQAVLEAAVREWSQYWYATEHIANIEALGKMLDSGLEILTLPEADVEKIRGMAMSIVDEFAAKDPLATKAWESQKDYMRLLGVLK